MVSCLWKVFFSTSAVMLHRVKMIGFESCTQNAQQMQETDKIPKLEL